MERLETNGAGDGNTEKRRHQHVYWVFTLNNYSVEQMERLEQILRFECKWYIFQEECGENGTPHLQGTICLIKRKRLTELKPIDKRIHWEPCRAVNRSILYCTKKATRVGKIFSYGIPVVEDVKTEQPRGWQLEVLKVVKGPVDPRKIYWYWEPRGGVGKSSLTKWLHVEMNSMTVAGKATDIYNVVARRVRQGKPPRIVVVDVPRS